MYFFLSYYLLYGMYHLHLVMTFTEFLFNGRGLGIIFEYTGKHLIQLHYWKVKYVSFCEDPRSVSSVLTPVLSSEPTSSQAFRWLHVLNCRMSMWCETPCFCLLHDGNGLEKILQTHLGLSGYYSLVHKKHLKSKRSSALDPASVNTMEQ